MTAPNAESVRPLRVKGHRLEVVSVNGGLVASCSCGEVYTPKAGRSQAFPTWERAKVQAMHQTHLAAQFDGSGVR